MRWLWTVLVVGCGAAPRAPASAPVATAPASTVELLPEVRPDPRPPPQPPRPVVRRGPLDLVAPAGDDDMIVLDGRYPRSIGGERQFDVPESDYLSRCVRELVQAQPADARRPWIIALTQYITSCDREGRVVLERPLGFDGRERRARTDASFVGVLSPQRVDLALRLAYCDGESASPDHVVIVVGDLRWKSPRLEFARDANGCDVAELAYTRVLGRALERVVDSADAAIRFEGTQLAGELAISDGVRTELRLILDALDASVR